MQLTVFVDYAIFCRRFLICWRALYTLTLIIVLARILAHIPVAEWSMPAPEIFIWGLWPRGSGSSLQTLFTDFDCRNNQDVKISHNLPPNSWPVCFMVGASDPFWGPSPPIPCLGPPFGGSTGVWTGVRHSKLVQISVNSAITVQWSVSAQHAPETACWFLV